MRKLLRVALAATTLAVSGLAAAQEKIELKLSHYLPPTHGLHVDFTEPWAKELEKRSGGRVTVKVFPGNSSLGNAANQLDQVQAGVVDIALGLSGIPRGRLPRTTIIDLPFMTDSADAASQALWAVYPRFLAEEYKGLKVLALFAHNPGLIALRNKKVEKVDDLKGLRIRAPSVQTQALLTALGATPVGMPPGQIYENMDKGVIDGAMLPYDGFKGFKVDELARYYYDADIYTTSFYFVMNQKKYDGLPPEVRKAIDEISGDVLVARFGGWWDKWDKAGMEGVKARNGVVVEATAKDKEALRKQLQPVVDQQLAELEKAGVPNARAIYDELRKETAKRARK
ncbi:MAG: TRAP transporter substrate-binding protein [Rhodocyclaceae bacterium]|nr:TRAP transporter substrate-binding protein [Rhodocyclaceae bacterium]